MKSNYRKTLIKARAFWFSLFYLLIHFTSTDLCYGKEINPIVLAAYRDVLDLNFEKARDKLKFVASNPEENPYEIYVSNLNDALEVYIHDSYELFDALKDTESSRLKKINRLPDDMPEKLFLDAEVRIHWAFIQLKFGHYFKAFWGFKQAYSSAVEGNEKFPGFLPYQKSMGVLHTIFGSFPDNYNWMLSLLNLEGNIKSGVSELDAVSSSQSYFNLETKIYKAIFESYLLNGGQKADESLDDLLKNDQPNYATQIVAAILFIKNGESQRAEQLIAQMDDDIDAHKIMFTYYLMGVINLQKGDYLKSIRNFQTFVSQYNGRNFRKDAYCKIAIAHWLNDDSNYTYYMRKTRDEGETIIDTDKNAEKMVEKDSLPNKILLKIRYATDGGYFERAGQILSQAEKVNFKNNREITEFHYRKARFYHKTNRYDDALKEYHLVVKMQKDPKDYFAANSCLQMGYLYLEKNACQKAEEYFKKAKEYRDHPYKYSIDKKANIELKKIEEILNEN